MRLLLCVWLCAEMQTNPANEILQIIRIECELIFDIPYMLSRVSIIFIQFIMLFILMINRCIMSFIVRFFIRHSIRD